MNDLRFAIRQLIKSPGFTVVAALTLALGIGVNTSMFTALQELLARPLPYPDPEQLVQLFQISAHSRREPHHSTANFLDYREQDPDFSFLAAFNDRRFNFSEPGQPAEQVRGLQVSTAFFPLLGIQPELGRAFTAEEDHPGRNQVVMLDHGFWMRRFAGETNIVGRVIRVDGESVTVVGVMPARFHDILLNGPVSLWRPIAFTDLQSQDRGNSFLKCLGRLKPGVSLAQAQGRMDILAGRLAQEHPSNSPDGLSVVPLAKSTLPAEARRIVWSIMALAMFVLLIACANLANLLFARTAARSRELAIRGALGAPRGRLLRQLLTESLLIALVGGLLGLALANWSNQLLRQQFAVDSDNVLSLALNVRVLLFALAASTFSALAVGLAPAWLASRTDVNHALKQGSRGTTTDRSQHRLQHSLIVAQVALALMLLAGAASVVSTLRGFARLNPGWQVDGLTLGFMTLPDSKYGSGDSQRAFVNRLEEKLGAMPGVQGVAVCWTMPVWQFNVSGTFHIDGRPEPREGTTPTSSINGITPGYFKTLGMRVLAGRDFTSFDTTNRPAVVIINESMARAFWPGLSPLGQRIDGQEIVGVVNDVHFPASPSERDRSFQRYRPFAQVAGGSLVVGIRGSISGATLRHAVEELDPDQPVGDPGPARGHVGKSLDHWALGGRLLSGFAALGLTLAALGIYGVISGFVVRRTGEIGTRMALGAGLSQVLWLVLGRGLRLSLFGTLIGLAGAFGITRLLAFLMPGLPGSNPMIVLLVAAFLMAVAFVASWLPARRAARMDPMVALRSE